MAKKLTHDRDKQAPTERRSRAVTLIELRLGFFLNADQIVSVRVLPQEEGEAYALMQLSNGDKLNLTHGEFTAVTGEDPRPPVRLRQKP
jgi:hypothetical protein